MADLTTRPAATTANDADLLYLHQGGVSKKITGENFRKLFGIRGDWDATPSSAAVAPDAGYTLEASVAGASPTFLMTPANGASLIKLAGSTPVTKEAGARSARISASASGGNFVLSALVVANATAAPADVAASLGFGATGTCTHIAAVLLDNAGTFGPGAMKIMAYSDDPVNGSATESLAGAGAYVAGDDVFLSLDTATGQIVANVNAGGDLAATQLFDTTGAAALRVYVLAYFSGNPPTLTGGTVSFDPSTTVGGRTGFASVTSAAPPVGAVDWSRWLVTAPGPYGGRDLVAGDVVEFYNSLASVIVTQGFPLDDAAVDALIAAWVAANPQDAPLIDVARARARMLTVNNDGSTAGYSDVTRGVCIMVGKAPSGPFATMTPGNVAVYDGAAFVEYNKALFEGTLFLVADNSPGGPGRTLRYVGHGGGLIASDIGGVFGPIPSQFPDGSTFDELKTLGWVLEYPHYLAALTTGIDTISEALPATLYVGEKQHSRFRVTATDNPCQLLPKAWGGAEFVGAAMVLEVFNQSSAARKVSFSDINGARGAYQIPPTGRQVFVAYMSSGFGVRIVPVSDPAWIAPTLVNSWANVGGQAQPTQYRMAGDKVEIRGSVQSGTSENIFTLPETFRPPHDVIGAAYVTDTGTPIVASVIVRGISSGGPAGQVELIGDAPAGNHAVAFNFSFSLQE